VTLRKGLLYSIDSLSLYILKHFVTSLIQDSVLSRLIFTSLSRREKDRARARSHFPRSNFAYIRESRGKSFTIILARVKEMTRRILFVRRLSKKLRVYFYIHHS